MRHLGVAVVACVALAAVAALAVVIGIVSTFAEAPTEGRPLRMFVMAGAAVALCPLVVWLAARGRPGAAWAAMAVGVVAGLGMMRWG